MDFETGIELIESISKSFQAETAHIDLAYTVDDLLRKCDRPHSIAWCWFTAIFGNFAVREFDQKLGQAELPERNWSSAATFFVVAHALGNVRLMAQRLVKSRLDGPYKQSIHTVLWII